MKFNKIMSVLGGIFLIGATAFAGTAAANLISSNSQSSIVPYQDTVVVYGELAATSDAAGAVNMVNALKNSITNDAPQTTLNLTGEAKAVETSSQALYLEDVMSNTKTVFTADQLPTVLADGVILDESGEDFEYNLKINVPNSVIKYGETADNFNTPVFYADFDNSNYKYDMRIIFPTAIEPSKFSDEFIDLFGKRYVFSGNAVDLSNTSVILYENSESVTVNDGESQVVTAGTQTHTFNVAVEDNTKALVYVDGVSKSVKEGFSGKINGVDVYVKDIYGPDSISSGRTRFVELYVNSNSMKLSDGGEVRIAGKDIPGTSVSFVKSGTKVSEIKITVTPNNLDKEIQYIKEGDTFADPVFNTLRFSLAGMSPKIDDTARDYIILKPSKEDRVSLEFTNKAGKEYVFEVLRPSSILLDSAYTPINVSNGTGVYNATELGGEYGLITSANVQIKEKDYFITTNNEYSQVWRVDNIGSDNKIELRDIATQNTVTLTIAVGDTGSLSLADGSSANVNRDNVTTIKLIDKAANYVYTKQGAKIILPQDNSGKIQVIEETAYNGGDYRNNNGTLIGNTMNFTYAFKKDRSGKDMFLRTTELGTQDVDVWKQDVGDYDVNAMTKYGTFISQTGDDDKTIEIRYSDKATRAMFYIGEQGTSLNPTPSTGILAIKDTELESYKDRNMIVVGGSCINAAAAALLGKDVPMCGDEWQNATGAGAGKYLVEVFNNPWSTQSGKIAILVAGYEAMDTTRAINEILSKPMNLSVGSKIIG